MDHILHVYRTIWNKQIFMICKLIEKIKLLSLSFTYRNQVQNTFKIWNLGLNYVSDLAQVEEARYITSCKIFSSE